MLSASTCRLKTAAPRRVGRATKSTNLLRFPRSKSPRTTVLISVLLAASAGLARDEPRKAVDLEDYPPYYDALKEQLDTSGITGHQTVPMVSILHEGVRVMPVQIGGNGDLPEIVAAVNGLGDRFPFFGRVASLEVGRSRVPDHAYAMKVTRLAPVAASQKEPGVSIERIDADRAHGTLLDSFVVDILGADDTPAWLDLLQVQGDRVTIRGNVPRSSNSDRILDRVLHLEGFVVAEVIGPQREPSSGAVLFLARGELRAD